MLAMLVTLVGSMPAYAEARDDTSSVPGWNAYISNIDGGAYIDDEESYSGSKSMKMYNNTIRTSGETYLNVSYPVNVENGKTYIYGFAAKVLNAREATVFMNWGTRSSLLPSGATANWKNFEFIYNSDMDGTAFLRFILDNKTEAIWVDDVYFYEVSGGARVGENMIKNPSFEDTATTKPTASDSAGGSMKIKTIEERNIKIDGDISDWQGIEPTKITKEVHYTGTNLSLAADIRYAYDDDFFYFVIDAEDDMHYPLFTSTYWNGDGLQFAVSKKNERNIKEYAYVAESGGQETVKGSSDLKCNFKRDGTLSRYEIAIPWKDYFTEGKPDAFKFCVVINDNDNDGAGRKGCLETSSGISDTKDSLHYLTILPDNGVSFNAWLAGAERAEVGDESNYTAALINTEAAEKRVKIESKIGNISENVTIPGNTTLDYSFKVKLSGFGPINVDFTVSDGETSIQRTASTYVNANADVTKGVIEKHKAHYAELSELVKRCDEKNLYTEYEKIDYNVIGNTIGVMEEAASKNDFTRIYYQSKTLDELYTSVKDKLTKYLDGTEKPIVAAKYVTSDISTVGKHFEATVDIDGEKKQQPVFFVGAGHWPNEDYYETLEKMGFNATQPEIGPWHFMKVSNGARDWYSESWDVDYKCKVVSDSGEKHGGQYSIKLNSTEPRKENAAFFYIFQNVPVKPNTTYEYGLWSKASNAKASASIDTSWSYRMMLNGTYDWRSNDSVFTTGPDQTSTKFYIIVEDLTDGLWIDDAYIREKGTNINLLKNGDFEDVNAPDTTWEIDPEWIDKITAYLDSCAEHNISAQFSDASHYIPCMYGLEHPEIYDGRSVNSGINFCSQLFIDMMEAYYRVLLPKIKDKPAFDGIILMNEPEYNSTENKKFFLPLFQNYVKEKYGSIDALNAKWGTNYASFYDVEMAAGIEKTAQSYDWRTFNDEILPGVTKKLADIVREYAPNVMMQTKMMQTFAESSVMRADSSNNWETLADSVDINCCDGWAYYRNDEQTIPIQMFFYDYQTSVKDAPIYNTEDHVIPDGSSMTFNDNESKHAIANLWQGALHGKCGSVIWFWERKDTRALNGGWLHNPNLTERPKDVSNIGKMTLNLNRLANEVTAVLEKDAEVGVLYTPNSLAYSDGMLNAAYQTFNALGENGQKTQVIVESGIEKLQDMKCLVIPNVVSVTDKTFDEIKKFAENGGTLIVYGQNNLTKNEYGEDRDKSAVDKVLANAVFADVTVADSVVDTNGKKVIRETITDYVEKNNMKKINLIDKETGKPIEDCEYMYAEYNGKYIINVCTYKDESENAQLYIDGKPVEKCVDLISMKGLDGSFEIPGYTPMLLSIEK